jgi:hypothetical protein
MENSVVPTLQTRKLSLGERWWLATVPQLEDYTASLWFPFRDGFFPSCSPTSSRSRAGVLLWSTLPNPIPFPIVPAVHVDHSHSPNLVRKAHSPGSAGSHWQMQMSGVQPGCDGAGGPWQLEGRGSSREPASALCSVSPSRAQLWGVLLVLL